MSTATVKVDLEVPAPLNLSHRCDRCGAQAFVRVTLNAGELLFCGHHYAKHEPTIGPLALKVQDERDRINEKPSVSASEI